MDLRDDAGPHFIKSPNLGKKARRRKDIWAQRGSIWAISDHKKPGDFRCKKRLLKHGSGLKEGGDTDKKSKRNGRLALFYFMFISLFSLW